MSLAKQQIMLVALFSLSCAPAPVRPVGAFQLAPVGATLRLQLEAPSRSVQYLRVSDWDTAEATLTREGEPVRTATATAVASADGRGRGATLVFPGLLEGSGYSLRVALKKRGRELGVLEQAGLSLAAGSNTLHLDAAPEARVTPSVAPVAGLGPYVSTIPGAGVAACLSAAQDVVAAGDGRYYFLDNGRLGLIYQDANGKETTRTLAGVDRKLGAGLVDGVGTMARFADPKHLALGPAGVLYVADAGGNAIRKVAIDGRGEAVVSTLAGDGVPGFVDGPGATARFSNPSDLAVDGEGNLWVADTDNHRIRELTFGTGGEVTVSTVAGDGTAGFLDGPAGTARFRSPGSLALGLDGTVYVADSRNFRIRALVPDGSGNLVVSTVAGSGIRSGLQDFVDDDGPGATARFGVMTALRRAVDGSLYVGDTLLKKVTFDGQGGCLVSTLGVDGNVQSDLARNQLVEFNANGIAFAPDGGVLIAAKGTIRRVEEPAGGAVVLRKWVGRPETEGQAFDGPVDHATFASFKYEDLLVDDEDNVYVMGKTVIYRLHASNLLAPPELIAGQPNTPGYQDGIGTDARFRDIDSSCIAPDGSIILTDFSSHILRRLVKGVDGRFTVSTFMGTPNVQGFRNGLAADALFFSPGGISRHPDGRLFLADNGNGLIRAISFDTQGNASISTVAGREPNVGPSSAGVQRGYLDGPAPAAMFKPLHVAVDLDGNLIVTDDFLIIRKVTFRSSSVPMVSTLAGSPGLISGTNYVDGIGTAARFTLIHEVVIGKHGEMYTGDRHRVRKIMMDSAGRAVVSTFLGAFAGTTDGPKESARFGEFNTFLGGLEITRDGDLLVIETDMSSNGRIRRISSMP